MGRLGRLLGTQRGARRRSGGSFWHAGGTLGAKGHQNDAQRGPKRRAKGTKIGDKSELVLRLAPKHVFRWSVVGFPLTFCRIPVLFGYFCLALENLILEHQKYTKRSPTASTMEICRLPKWDLKSERNPGPLKISVFGFEGDWQTVQERKANG